MLNIARVQRSLASPLMADRQADRDVAEVRGSRSEVIVSRSVCGSSLTAQVAPAALRSRRRRSERKLDHTTLSAKECKLKKKKKTTTSLNGGGVKGAINHHGNQSKTPCWRHSRGVRVRLGSGWDGGGRGG